MFSRPQLGETDEDLIKQEQEFLKASGKQLNSKRSNEDEIEKEKKHKALELLGDIVEKNHLILKSGRGPVGTPAGFPEPFIVDPKVATGKQGKKSLFALHVKKNKHSVGNSLPTVTKEVMFPNQTKSYILTGENADQIHQENLKTLSEMPEAEILAEQQKLQETLDPVLIEFLKKRRKHQTVAQSSTSAAIPSDNKHFSPVEADQIRIENMDVISATSEEDILIEQKRLQEILDPSLVAFLKQSQSQSDKVESMEVIESTSEKEVKDKLKNSKDKKWVNMDFIEKNKLEWIGDIPDTKALEPDQPYSARFDFDGELQPFKTDIDVTKSLHHHGDEPERPGYTIQELYQLSRSTVLQQRILALNTIARIIRKTKLGYYDKCFDGFLLHKLIESDLFFLLRFSIDENALIPASLHCLHQLLHNQTDEFCLDKLLGMTDSDTQPLLFNEIDKDEEKELKDHIVISCDLVKGVLRTDLLLRLSYILNQLTPAREGVIHVIESLIRISRHSVEAAEQILNTQNLVKFVYSVANSSRPMHESVKLFRILIAHSREIAFTVSKDYSMRFLLSFIDAEEIPTLNKTEFYHLKLQSIYLWRCFLHYDIMLDEYESFTPCLLRLLYFFVEKIDINQGSDFDFELFSSIVSMLITCAYKKITIHPNFVALLKICLEKWSKQLLAVQEYNFSNLKAIGSAFRFFIVYFRTFGVDGPSLRFVKEIDATVASLLRSDVFRKMSKNLVSYSYLLSMSQVQRDPQNLPSLCSIYEGGSDYLRIVQKQSTLPFFMSLVEYLISSFRISKSSKSNVELFVSNSNIREYVQLFCALKRTQSWFMRYEKLFLTTLLELYEVEKDNQLMNFGFRLLTMMRTDDGDVRRVTAIICSQKNWESEFDITQPKFESDSSLTSPYKKDLIPEDWMYKPITEFRGLEKTLEMANTLKFTSLIIQQKPELLQRVSFALRYYHLCVVFLTDSNVFDPNIQTYLELNFEDVLTNRDKVDLNEKVDQNKSFYDLYTELITQYAGLSYGLQIFAKFVVFPLQNRFDISFRKLLWSEYLHVLSVVTLPFPMPDYVPINEFFEPSETDESLLVTYLNSISSKVFKTRRNPFIYQIALENVKNYVRSENSDEKLTTFLKRKIGGLEDLKLQSELLN